MFCICFLFSIKTFKSSRIVIWECIILNHWIRHDFLQFFLLWLIFVFQLKSEIVVQMFYLHFERWRSILKSDIKPTMIRGFVFYGLIPSIYFLRSSNWVHELRKANRHFLFFFELRLKWTCWVLSCFGWFISFLRGLLRYYNLIKIALDYFDNFIINFLRNSIYFSLFNVILDKRCFRISLQISYSPFLIFTLFNFISNQFA